MSASETLDEISVAPSAVVNSAIAQLSHGLAEHVGSVVEYAYLRRFTRPELARLATHSRSPIVRQIDRLLDSNHELEIANLCLQPTQADSMIVPAGLGAVPAWTAFVKRAEVTARDVGFPDSIAAGLGGAIQELADNIVQHSESPNSGMVAFSRTKCGFEYVVADAGIGMLASLRTSPEYRSLRDDLEALPLAIAPGVSRHGRGSGHGYGFRTVFLPLAAASGTVRLRSGSAVLQISGLGPAPDRGTCSQRPHHQGVVVAVELMHNLQ